MSDPRNVAHDKKVQHDKKRHGEEIAPGADETPQPGKKPHMAHHASDDKAADKVDQTDATPSDQQPDE